MEALYCASMKSFISVTPIPSADTDLTRYAAVVNVSDSPGRAFSSPVPHFWFPIHETGFWGYHAFYGAAKVFDKFRDQGQILIHCHGGISRSPSVAFAIALSEFQSWVQAEEAFGYYGKRYGDAYRVELNRKRIPKDVVRFLIERKVHPTFSLGGLLTSIKSPDAFPPGCNRGHKGLIAA